MTSKQRSYLKGLAMTIDPVFQIGKASLTPEVTQAVSEVLAERTHSEVVQVIGRKIVLYRPAKEENKRKIVLPK